MVGSVRSPRLLLRLYPKTGVSTHRRHAWKNDDYLFLWYRRKGARCLLVVSVHFHPGFMLGSHTVPNNGEYPRM